MFGSWFIIGRVIFMGGYLFGQMIGAPYLRWFGMVLNYSVVLLLLENCLRNKPEITLALMDKH